MSSSQETQTPQQNEWPKRETAHSPVLSKDEARQGTTGHNVRYVLGISVVAVVLIFLVIYLVFFG